MPRLFRPARRGLSSLRGPAPALTLALGLGLALALGACGDDASSSAADPGASESPDRLGLGSEAGWFAAWGTALYTTYPNGPLTQGGNSASTGTFTGNEAVNQSFRMMVRPSTGGRAVRLHFSNAFGTRDLVLENASVALRAAPSGPAITGTPVPVTFGGQKRVSIPPGGAVTSDGAVLNVPAGQDVAVSFHAPGPSGPMSWHAEAFSTQYASRPNSGDVSTDATGAMFTNVNRGWFFLDGLDLRATAADAATAAPTPPAIVFFGDSITDGFGSVPEANGRYPDLVAERLRAAGMVAGVVNAGINSNTVTPSRDPVTTGPPGVARFARDALARSNVQTVFLLEGTNDLSFGKSAAEILAGLETLAAAAHARGACVVASTILPRDDPPQPFGWDAATEEPVRQRLNELIRTSPAFDAVVDLSTVMANPAAPNLPFQPYFVEGLHPNPLGYRTMAGAIPLATLLPPLLGTCRR